MKLRFALLLLLMSFSKQFLLAQNISGTINIYTNVTNIAGSVVTVGSSAGYANCDRVMIIQMKGAAINTVNNSTFGQINTYNNVGNYEFATVASVSGNQITLNSLLSQTYTTTGIVQLIRVPVYNNPIITGTLTCTPWNGTKGGVLAFESTGIVTFNANIDVTGSGFKGGNSITGGFGCNNSNYATSTHGKKGEGITIAPVGFDSHIAPLANGGGGSSPGNCGAAGGGNFGAGGRGGNEYSGCGGNGIFGMGGYALTIIATKAFLGGGGGGGYIDNGQPCASGENGGGIVMINAPSIAGNGFSILAKGSNVTTITNDEGAGGGGAGGSVYLRVPTVTSALNVDVSGGSGGNIENNIYTFDAHGTGGGGGGGYVWVTSAVMPTNISVTSTGGAAGIIQHVGSFFNTSYGAAVGSAGSTLFNLPALPISATSPPVNLGADTISCSTNITLQADTVYSSYLWSTGATTQTINVNTSGTYWMEASIGCGIIDRDSIQVTLGNSLVNLGSDKSFCLGDSVQFNAGVGFASYVWNTGESSSSIYANLVGQYIVNVLFAGCSGADTANVINLFPKPVINLGSDQSFCFGNNIVLNPGLFNSYQWQDGSVLSNYLVGNSGTYFVEVSDINNCQNSDTVSFTVFSLPVFSLGADVGICMGDLVQVSPNGLTSTVSYLWSDNSTNSMIEVLNEGIFYLTVTDINNCKYTDTINIVNGCPPTIYIPNSFTPNLDEINQLFKAYGTNIQEYKMDIFDRWGVLLYTINEITNGWNGKINELDAPIGLYAYKITYRVFLKTEDLYLTGGFSLIR